MHAMVRTHNFDFDSWFLPISAHTSKTGAAMLSTDTDKSNLVLSNFSDLNTLVQRSKITVLK